MKRLCGVRLAGLLTGCALCALVLGGCVSGPHELPLSTLISSGAPAPSGAESGPPVVKLRLGTGTLAAELANTPLQAATGLAFRTSLLWDQAMLFVYSTTHRASFYMKNTSIPLSVAYLDGSGTVLEIHDLKPGDETPVVSRTDNVQFVLEVNWGWFRINDVTTGSRVYVER